jgi:hypothetical protein
MVGLMMSFYSWRSLTRDIGLDRDRAIRLAVGAIIGAERAG